MAEETNDNGEFYDLDDDQVENESKSKFEEERSRLIRENKDNSDRIKLLTDELEGLKADRVEMSRRLDEKAAEKQKEVDRAEEYKRALREISSRKAELETEVSRLRNDLITARGVNEESGKELRVARNDKAERESRIVELEKRVGDVEVLRNEKSELGEALKKAQKRAEELEKKVSKVEGDVVVLDKEKKEKETENDSLKEALNKSETEIGELQSELDRDKSENEKRVGELEKKVSSVEGKVVVLEKEKKEKEAENASLKEALKKSETELEKTEAIVQELRSNLEKNRVETRIGELKNTLLNVEGEIAALRKEKEIENASLGVDLKKSETKVAEMEAKVRELNEKNTSGATEKLESENRIRELKNIVSNVEGEVVVLKKAKEEKESENASLEEALRKFETKVRETEAKVHELQTKLEDLYQKNTDSATIATSIDQEKSENEDRIRELTNKVLSVAGENLVLKEDKKEKENENASLVEAVKKSETRVHEMEVKVHELQSKLEELNQKSLTNGATVMARERDMESTEQGESKGVELPWPAVALASTGTVAVAVASFYFGYSKRR